MTSYPCPIFWDTGSLLSWTDLIGTRLGRVQTSVQPPQCRNSVALAVRIPLRYWAQSIQSVLKASPQKTSSLGLLKEGSWLSSAEMATSEAWAPPLRT